MSARDPLAQFPGLALRSISLCVWRHIARHGILPVAIGELTLVGAVGVHNPVLAVWLEGVVVEGCFIFESVYSAVPHDPGSVIAPHRVSVAGWGICESLEVRAIRMDDVDVEFVVLRS